MSETAGPSGNLTTQAIGGLRWTVVATMATLAMQLVYTAFMGRLLQPRDFGLVASAQIVLQFGTYFSEMGLGQALIQKEDLVEEEVRAAFTSSVLLGAIITGLVVLGAPGMARLFASDNVVPVVQALAFSLLLTSVGLTSANLLRRQLRFDTIAKIEVGSYVVAYLGVGLGMAFAGFGVWSLVAAFLSQVAIKSACSMLAARHGYRPILAIRRLKRLYAFGGRISIISGLEYIGQAVVVVVIGRYAGQGPLGQYNRASLLIELPVLNLNFQLANVLFPTLSRLQRDVDRARRGYLQSVRIVAALLMPVAAGIAVAADQIVLLVLGDQWGTASDLLPVLAIAVTFNALSFFGGITSEALGALNTKMILQGTYAVLLIAGLLAVPSDRIIGYAIVLAVAELLRLVAYAVFMGRLLDIPVADQWRTFLPPVAAAGVVAGGIGLVTFGLTQVEAPLLVTFACQVLTGALLLALSMTHGPLRGARRELRDRLHGAYGGDDAGRVVTIAVRALSVGDHKAV